MPRIEWDTVGSRRFETGVDRGVLFTKNDLGIPWSGLTSVKESSSGAEVADFYLDGIKYLGVPGREEVGGTIEAFTYPDEFGYHDGTFSLDSGLIVTQQRRRPFNLSYRTRLGNDINGVDNGYKIHILYNVLAEPSEHTYNSMGSSVEPETFSWGFSTTPRKPKNTTRNYAPMAHVIIDSTKTPIWLLNHIENLLYGSTRNPATLIAMDDLFHLFEHPSYVLSVFADRVRGLSPLTLETTGTGDLIGDQESGLYAITAESRLIPAGVPGFYKLDS